MARLGLFRNVRKYRIANIAGHEKALGLAMSSRYGRYGGSELIVGRGAIGDVANLDDIGRAGVNRRGDGSGARPVGAGGVLFERFIIRVRMAATMQEPQQQSDQDDPDDTTDDTAGDGTDIGAGGTAVRNAYGLRTAGTGLGLQRADLALGAVGTLRRSFGTINATAAKDGCGESGRARKV